MLQGTMGVSGRTIGIVAGNAGMMLVIGQHASSDGTAAVQAMPRNADFCVLTEPKCASWMS